MRKIKISAFSYHGCNITDNGKLNKLPISAHKCNETDNGKKIEL